MSERASYIYALSTLTGSTIGAGLFALPYICSKVGIFVIIGYFLILGFIVLSIHLIFAEEAFQTPDFLRLPGFAEIYLGKKKGIVSSIVSISGFIGIILVYIILGGKFLTSLLSPLLGGNYILYSLIYFLFGSFFIFFGIKAIDKIELLSILLLVVTTILLFIKGWPLFNFHNLIRNPVPQDIFLPYGPIMFSLWSLGLIPEIEEMLGKNKKLLPKVILNSIIIAALFYLFFILVIVGISGSAVSKNALSSLPQKLGSNFIVLIILVGIITTFTSFLTSGLTLKKIFWYDLKMNKNLSWAITCFVPLILFFSGLRNFIPIISLVGAIMFGLNGVTVLLIYQKIKGKKVQALTIPLILFLTFGIIYEIIYLPKI